jgi:uncharacterized protein YcfJ
MKMQAKIIVSLLGMGAISVVNAADFDDYARVVSVAPQTEQINHPQQECRTEYQQVERHRVEGNAPRSAGGSVVGGIAGALLGNQIGSGNGRTAATAAGAIVGAITGDRLENSGNNGGGRDVVTTTEQPVRQCRTVDHWEARTTFNVTYDYRGHTYTNLMTYDPGERIRVRVSVVPHQ